MHTQWSAAFDAKNRYDLPEVLPLDWQNFFSLAQGATQDSQKIKDEIVSLLPELPEERREKATAAMEAVKTYRGLCVLLDRIKAEIATQ